MATQTAGIQQLLAAEKKAAETVGEARKSLFKHYYYYYFYHKSINYNNINTNKKKRKS
jgi:hypothetical protein